MTAYDETKALLRAEPRRWLVTGVAGFIGSNLLQALLELDQTVVGLDNFSTGKRANLDEVRAAVSPERWARFRLLEGDVASPDVCARAVAGVERILHQAALGSVPRSIEEPLETNAANVTGQLALLEAARRAGVRRFVYASSSSVYGDDPTPAQGRGPARPAALALRRHQADGRALRGGLRRAARPRDRRPALLQRVRPAPGSRGRLRRRDPALDGGHDPRRRGAHQRHGRDEPRLLLRRERRPGQPAGGDHHARGGARREPTTSRSAAARRCCSCSRRCAPGSRHASRGSATPAPSTARSAPATCCTRSRTSARRAACSATSPATRSTRASTRPSTGTSGTCRRPEPPTLRARRQEAADTSGTPARSGPARGPSARSPRAGPWSRRRPSTARAAARRGAARSGARCPPTRRAVAREQLHVEHPARQEGRREQLAREVRRAQQLGPALRVVDGKAERERGAGREARPR